MEGMRLGLHTILDNLAFYLAKPLSGSGSVYLYPELNPEWLDSPSSIFFDSIYDLLPEA